MRSEDTIVTASKGSESTVASLRLLKIIGTSAQVLSDEALKSFGIRNARTTQLMNLTLLAPSIQEEISGMTVESGRTW